VLACRREFAALQPEVVVALTTALLEACRWLDVPGNRQQAVDWLADPAVIGLPAERIAACLLPSEVDDPSKSLRFHADGEVNFPWRSDGHWFLQQFRRWGWLPAGSDEHDAALLDNVRRVETYREAAASVGVPVPASDTRGAPSPEL
jgi:nitrate/nitrite transport system substrate-binding protein